MNLQALFFFSPITIAILNQRSRILNLKWPATSITKDWLDPLLLCNLTHHACWHRVKRVSWRSGLDHFGHNHNYYAHGCLAKSDFMSSWEMPSCCHHFLLGPEGCWVSWRPGGLSIKACSVMKEENQPP